MRLGISSYRNQGGNVQKEDTSPNLSLELEPTKAGIVVFSSKPSLTINKPTI